MQTQIPDGGLQAGKGKQPRRGRKPAAPTYRKLTLNVGEATHQKMQEMADARQIPVTELMRRAFTTYKALDELLRQYPNARIALDETEGSAQLGLAGMVPVGHDAW